MIFLFRLRMYRFITPLFFCLIALCGGAHAQSFHAAIKAGISSTQVSGDNLGGFDQLGGAVGGVVGLPLSDKIDLNLEILFVQKGSRKLADPDNEDYKEYLLRLNYFEFPLFLQYKHSSKIALEAGPILGVLVSSKEEDELGPYNWTPPRPFDQTEIGAGGGLSYNFSGNWSVVSRFETSILPIRPHQSGQTYQWNRGQYNTVLLFMLQYRFNKSNAS
ncbi:MAG: outer membrane beta-barrel protein [Bacteroidia bacterium]